MPAAATSGLSARSILGFLTVSGLALLGAACGGGQLPSPDGGGPSTCTTRGCSVAPMCGTACTDVCGCCPCTPGDRWNALVCADQGCWQSLAPACALPFDPGPCRAAIAVYAFIDGACVAASYGGCEGNDNRFATLEDCLAVCEGRPTPNACPAGRIAQSICLACGAAGGCAQFATVCALPCPMDGGVGNVCPAELPVCYQGVCQNAYCE